jgi:hypothetical protein
MLFRQKSPCTIKDWKSGKQELNSTQDDQKFQIDLGKLKKMTNGKLLTGLDFKESTRKDGQL